MHAKVCVYVVLIDSD